MDSRQSLSDFNDLHQLAGLGEVARQVNKALKQGLPPRRSGTTCKKNVSQETPLPPVDSYSEDDKQLSVDLTSFDLSSRGRPLKTIFNLVLILDLHNVSVWFNVVSKEIEIDFPRLKTTVENKLDVAIAHIEDKCALHGIPTTSLQSYLLAIADRNARNRVKEWIVSKGWDGVDRFGKFLSTLETPDDKEKLRNLLVLRWMTAAVAAAYEEKGFTSHGVLTLQGDQGIGKSAWCKRLVPVNEDWVKTEALLDPRDKDSVKECISYWITELGELDATFRKSDIAALKHFLTRDVDEIRLPYARAASRFPRRTVFCGSVNEEAFLADPTGNRRYWVIQVKSIDYQHDIDMQQLWAQVLTWYLEGERPYLSFEEQKLLEDNNRQHLPPDPIKELVISGLDWDSPDTAWSYRSTTEIMKELGGRTDRSSVTRAGGMLSRKGSNKKIVSGVTRYLVPQRLLKVDL